MALHYYEQGLSSLEMEIEIRHKLSSESMTEDQFWSDIQNIIPPELLLNMGVLRLEISSQLEQTNVSDSKKRLE